MYGLFVRKFGSSFFDNTRITSTFAPLTGRMTASITSAVSYQNLHYLYQMETAVNIGFWWNAPIERRTLQQLELSLIQKWRSPFNKENWDLWGQSFKGTIQI
jgi:hypothetical protein